MEKEILLQFLISSKSSPTPHSLLLSLCVVSPTALQHTGLLFVCVLPDLEVDKIKNNNKNQTNALVNVESGKTYKEEAEIEMEAEETPKTNTKIRKRKRPVCLC